MPYGKTHSTRYARAASFASRRCATAAQSAAQICRQDCDYLFSLNIGPMRTQSITMGQAFAAKSRANACGPALGSLLNKKPQSCKLLGFFINKLFVRCDYCVFLPTMNTDFRPS